MIDPPRWTEEQLNTGLLKAQALFRQERMEEPLEAYLEAFELYQGAVEDLLKTSVDLVQIDERSIEILTDPELLKAFRCVRPEAGRLDRNLFRCLGYPHRTLPYAQPVSIARIAELSAEAQAVEGRAIALVKASLDALVAEYRQRFGVVVGTDLAREIFPDYTASIECRLKFAAAVQRSAAAVADEAFARIVAESRGGDALFTAGGTGAGKTTAITENARARELLSGASIIYDSNFNSLNSAKEKLRLALDAGLQATVIYVHRHPVAAFLQGVLPRALSEGRAVPIEGHLRMHKDALKTFLRVQRAFADDPRAMFLAFINTGAKEDVFLADIAYLKGVQYDQEELYNAIREGLDHAYRTGRISEALYTGCVGSRLVEPPQG